MPLDVRFFPDFLVALPLTVLPLVEALEVFLEARLVAAFLVEARLLPLAAARFRVEAALVFLLADFLLVFLVPRELVDFLNVIDSCSTSSPPTVCLLFLLAYSPPNRMN